MISFRYHLVSLVAVFLALALGIVVGTTALSGPITKDLRNQLDDTKKQRNDLADQTKSLQGQVDNANQFAATYGGQLVSNTLPRKNVLLVVLPGARSGMQAGITKQIAAAGARVSGVITLTRNYLDPRQGSGITSLATGPTHPTGLTYTETSDAGVLGGELLSYVLLGKAQSGEVSQVLAAFSGLHMLTLSASSIVASNLVVVIGSGGRGDSSASDSKADSAQSGSYGVGVESALVKAMTKSGGHVVVSADKASAADKGLVATLRDDTAQRNAAATVDDANTAFGQVTSVLALVGAARGQVGHYGTQEGADALFPAPSK